MKNLLKQPSSVSMMLCLLLSFLALSSSAEQLIRLEKDSVNIYNTPLTASIINGTIALQWGIENIKSTENFDIWRSENGIDWLWTKSISPNGDTIQKYYTAYDLNPALGNYFYKVTQKKSTEESITHGIVYINYDDKHDLKIYPNPTYNCIHLLYNKSYYQFSKIQILNIIGEPIAIFDADVSKIDIQTYDPGFYFLQFLSDQNEVLKKKIWVKH